MKLNPPNAHRSPIKICEKRQTRNVQFRFMQNAFRILKPIQKSLKCVWVFRNTGADAFAKNQTRLAYEDKRDLYCSNRSTRRPGHLVAIDWSTRRQNNKFSFWILKMCIDLTHVGSHSGADPGGGPPVTSNPGSPDHRNSTDWIWHYHWAWPYCRW